MKRFTWILLACLTASPVVAGDLATDALALINQHRAAAGCGPLRQQSQLIAAATGHANAMAKQDFYSHASKGGGQSDRRMRAHGYSARMTGENIAAGQKTAAAVVQSWMDSTGHRRNILNCRYTETGLAVAYQADDKPIQGNSQPLYYYWVQDFGRP